MNTKTHFTYAVETGLPKFCSDTVVLLMHFQANTSIADASKRISLESTELDSLAQRFSEATGREVCIALCCTDFVSQARLRDPENAAVALLSRSRRNELRAAVKSPRVAVVTMESLAVLLDRTSWKTSLSETPSRCFASGELNSSYQVPKTMFALVRAANRSNLCLQFDSDCIGDEQGMLSVVTETLNHRSIPSTRGRITSGGYSQASEWQAPGPNPDTLVDGTSVRVGQLAVIGSAAGFAADLADTDRRKQSINLERQTTVRFLNDLRGLGNDVHSQVISGSGLVFDGSAFDDQVTAFHFATDRTMCMFGDDATFSRILEIGGFSAPSRLRSVIRQQRHQTGTPAISDVSWHLLQYVPRLLAGLALRAIVETDAFADCLLRGKAVDTQVLERFWDAAVDTMHQSASSWVTLGGTALAMYCQGWRDNNFADFAQAGAFQSQFAPDGLCQTFSGLGTLLAAQTERAESCAGRLAMLVHDVGLFLHPGVRSVWYKIVTTARK
jgi:hypothetical protein